MFARFFKAHPGLLIYPILGTVGNIALTRMADKHDLNQDKCPDCKKLNQPPQSFDSKPSFTLRK